MNRRVLRLIPLFVSVLILVSCGQARIRLGTAAKGGFYYALGNQLADASKEAKGPTLEVRETAGSAANLRLLSQGYLELGIVQNDLIEDAVHGTGSYEGQPLSGFSAIAGLYTEACQVIVRADSDIESVYDLFGHTVSVGEKESGAESSAWRILSAYGIRESQLTAKNLNYEAAAKALQNGEIDAAFVTVHGAVASFVQVSGFVPIRLLPVDGRGAATVIRESTCYENTVIPAGTYIGQEDDVETVGVRAVLLASDKLEESAAKTLTGALFAAAQKLDFTLTPETAQSGVPVAFHKGAEAYYKEGGQP